MSEEMQPRLRWPLKPWPTILLFGFLQAALTGFGVFFDIASGIGMMFIYVTASLNAVVVILPILLIRRFGVGTAVYLPWATAGLFMDYYMEYVVNPVLRSPWGAAGWCVFGLLVGLSADLAYRFLPAGWSERRRAITASVVMGLVDFALTLVAVSFFYLPGPVAVPAPPTYASIAPWAAPWLLANSAFGGYLAYAIWRKA